MSRDGQQTERSGKTMKIVAERVLKFRQKKKQLMLKYCKTKYSRQGRKRSLLPPPNRNNVET